MAITTRPLPPSPPKNRKVPHMKSKITVKYSGKNVDLEDAFEMFEEVFDSTEEVFANMDRLFGVFDKDISSKLEELKKRMAKNRPDEFDYFPETDKEMEFAKTIRSKEDWKDPTRLLKIYVIGAVVAILLSLGILLLKGQSKPEPGTAIKNEVLMKQIDKTPKTGGMNKL